MMSFAYEHHGKGTSISTDREKEKEGAGWGGGGGVMTSNYLMNQRTYSIQYRDLDKCGNVANKNVPSGVFLSLGVLVTW